MAERRGRKRKLHDASDWKGYFESKQKKLHHQFTEGRPGSKGEKSESSIFSEISIFVNGYTDPTANELKRLMALHGGVYNFYYNPRKTTHIIATNLPNSKIRNLKDQKVVRPEWIVESIAAKKLLPCRPYELYVERGLTFAAVSKTPASATVVKEVDKAPEPEELPSSQSSEEHSEVLFSTPEDADEAKKDAAVVDKQSGTEQESKKGQEKGDLFEGAEHAEESPCKAKTKTNKASEPETFSTVSASVATRTVKAGDANFLTEFYGHSRLHYISAMKIEFRQYVSKLQQTSDGGFVGHQKLREWIETKGSPPENASDFNISNSKVIFHVDMDCFFVSVGLRKCPQYKGKPVAVTHVSLEKNNSVTPLADSGEPSEGHKPSMSEIASCNYEARERGLHNGMFLGEALKLCPELLTIPYNFEDYKDVAQKLYHLVSTYTMAIEAVSCDEMLADCTNVLRAVPEASPEELAECIRNDVELLTDCTCSIGIAHNCLLARMATRKAKPNGCCFIPFDDALDFLNDEPVRDLPGVGRSIESRLGEMGVGVCAELQEVPLATLKNKFGPKLGQTLYNFCRGIDDREIQVSKLQQSVSADVNYGIRFTKLEEANSFLADLSNEVAARLKKVGRKGRVITLKLKVRKPDAPTETAKFMGHGLCNNVTRSMTLKNSTDDPIAILKECQHLLQLINAPVSDLRGVGIQVSKLVGEDSASHAASTPSVKDFLQGKFHKRRVSTIVAVDMEDKLSHREDILVDSVDEQDGGQSFLSKDMTNLEIRELLKDWVANQDAPLSDDVDVIARFLTSFVDDLDLERLSYLLHLVLKILAGNTNASWTTAKERIRETVQRKMVKTYGGHLKLNA